MKTLIADVADVKNSFSLKSLTRAQQEKFREKMFLTSATSAASVKSKPLTVKNTVQAFVQTVQTVQTVHLHTLHSFALGGSRGVSLELVKRGI